MRLAGLRALSLRGGGDSEGDSAGVSEQHGAAIAALQVGPISALTRAPTPAPTLTTDPNPLPPPRPRPHLHPHPAPPLPLTPTLTPQADPDPAVCALARSLLSRIDPNRLTSPVRPEAGAQEAGGSESEDVEANVPPT